MGIVGFHRFETHCENLWDSLHWTPEFLTTAIYWYCMQNSVLQQNTTNPLTQPRCIVPEVHHNGKENTSPHYRRQCQHHACMSSMAQPNLIKRHGHPLHNLLPNTWRAGQHPSKTKRLPVTSKRSSWHTKNPRRSLANTIQCTNWFNSSMPWWFWCWKR